MKTLPMCDSQHKKRYPSQAAAIRAALAYSKKRGVALRTYRHKGPKGCGGWHVTKKARFDFDTNAGRAS